MHERHRARSRRPETLIAGDEAVKARERAVPDAEDRRRQSRVLRQREPQAPREGEGPHPRRCRGEDRVHEVDGTRSGAPPRT